MDENQLLAQYGRTMRSAQILEERLKTLFSLYKVIAGLPKNAYSLSNGEFELLMLTGERKTLGQALHGILQELSKTSAPPFPAGVEEILWETVQTRNFVAHRYFQARGFLIKHEPEHPYLIAELEWIAEMFDAWIPKLDRWTDQLLSALGIGEKEIKEAQGTLVEVIPDFRREQLAELKSNLERIGVDVPPIPHK